MQGIVQKHVIGNGMNMNDSSFTLDIDKILGQIDVSFDDAVYTVFDIETTGLSVNFDKVIEIAAVKIKNNQIIAEYQTYVNPEMPISELTTKITSIKNSDLALAPKIDVAIVEFNEFFKNTICVAHNAQFDMGFINKLLKDHNLYNEVWQAGAMLTPIQSVGVMGDERTYEHVVALRAVSSTDGMTADWSHLPYTFLAEISNAIINRVKGVNRVVYDISSKPPATIEWE